MLRLDEALRDAPAQSRHRLAAFVAAPGCGCGRTEPRFDAVCPEPSNQRASTRQRRAPDAGMAAAGEGEGAEEAAGAAAAEVSRCASTSALVRRPSLPVPEIVDGSRPCSSTSRRHRGTRTFGAGSGSRCGGLGRGHHDQGGGRLGRGTRNGGRGRAGIDPGQHLLAQDRVAGVLQHLGEHPGLGRRHLQHDLVGLELDQDLVLLDPVARPLSPLQQRGVRNGLGKHRHLHLDGHCGISSHVPDPWPDACAGSHRRRRLHGAAFAHRCSVKPPGRS